MECQYQFPFHTVIFAGGGNKCFLQINHNGLCDCVVHNYIDYPITRTTVIDLEETFVSAGDRNNVFSLIIYTFVLYLKSALNPPKLNGMTRALFQIGFSLCM